MMLVVVGVEVEEVVVVVALGARGRGWFLCVDSVTAGGEEGVIKVSAAADKEARVDQNIVSLSLRCLLALLWNISRSWTDGSRQTDQHRLVCITFVDLRGI